MTWRYILNNIQDSNVCNILLKVLNNTACIIAELIVKNEIVVDGKEMIDRIISTDTIETLFSQLDLNVRRFIYGKI